MCLKYVRLAIPCGRLGQKIYYACLGVQIDPAAYIYCLTSLTVALDCQLMSVLSDMSEDFLIFFDYF